MSIPDYRQCKYDVPWAGRCQKEAVGSDYCDEHNVKCSACKQRQATHGCSHAGQFVCGYPLCDKCQSYKDGKHKHWSPELEELALIGAVTGSQQ